MILPFLWKGDRGKYVSTLPVMVNKIT